MIDTPNRRTRAVGVHNRPPFSCQVASWAPAGGHTFRAFALIGGREARSEYVFTARYHNDGMDEASGFSEQ